MASFGPYETNREISSAAGTEVFGARKAGEPTGPEYAVKVYSLEGMIGDDRQTRSDLDPVLLELSRSFSSRIEIQKNAAQVSACVAPVLESGRNARGAWYVTLLYPRTLQKIVVGNVALSDEGLCRVIRCVTEGALALKRSAGRSHGNLKLANVLLGGAGRIRNAEVVVTDPLPGDAGEAQRYEQADLRDIGRMIYQLVLRREIADSDDWVLILPLAGSKEWTATFGKKAERWIKLCNRLLDPNLATETFGLEDLLGQLVLLEPKPAISGRKLALIAGFACLCGVALVVWKLCKPPPRGVLDISVDPPQATILLDRKLQKAGRAFVKFGLHTNVAQYPGFTDLTNVIDVSNNVPVPVELKLEYFTVKVSSDPPDASVKVVVVATNGTESTSNVQNPGQVILPRRANLIEMTFQKSGYTNVVINLPTSGLIDSIPVHAVLGKPPTNHLRVTFTDLLRGAVVTIKPDSSANPDGVQETTNSPPTWETFLLPGQYHLSASYAKLQPVNFSFEVKQATNISVPLEWAIIKFTSDFGDVGEVSIEGADWKSNNPSDLTWRPGPVTFNFNKEGFERTNVTLNLTNGQRLSIVVNPPPAVGFGFVTSDPDGAEVKDSTNGQIPLRKPVQLKQGSYTWRGHYGGLEDITNRFTVKLRETNNVLFKFSYGRLDLSVAPTNATVNQDGHRLTPPYTNLILKPGQHDYSVDNPGFDSSKVTISLLPGDSKKTNIELLAKMVFVHFVTDPPGGQMFDDKGNLIPEKGANLRGGSYLFTATYPGLKKISTNLQVQEGDLILKFQYGTLIFISLPPGATVFRENVHLGTTPLTNYFQPSPTNSYSLICENRTNVQMAGVDLGVTKIIRHEFPITDLIGIPLDGSKLDGSTDLKLKKIANYWVGQYDVTQSQFEQVIGTNPSFFSKEQLGTNWSPHLPVENVYPSNALAFCEKLTQQTSDWLNTHNLRGYTFTLPSKDEWLGFLGDGKNANLVYFKQSQTQEVGRQGPNNKGIYDACGNVGQWLSNGYVAGPSFQSGIIWSFDGTKPGNNARAKDVGFRVILKPPSP